MMQIFCYAMTNMRTANLFNRAFEEELKPVFQEHFGEKAQVKKIQKRLHYVQVEIPLPAFHDHGDIRESLEKVKEIEQVFLRAHAFESGYQCFRRIFPPPVG